MIWVIAGIVRGIIWGIVVEKIIENKGYKENWFWWGFLFGILALLVALSKKDKNIEKPIEKIKIEQLADKVCIERVNIYSKIQIVSWKIEKENDIKVNLNIDFMNTSEDVISAVLFSIHGFNVFGDLVYINEKDSFEILKQDLSMRPGNTCSIKTELPDADIRRVEIEVKKVCLVNGIVEENNEIKYVETNREILNEKYLGFAKQENKKARYYAIMKNEYWQCVCGFVNIGNTCKICGMAKKAALKFSKEEIEKTYEKYQEKVQKEERKKEERIRLQKIQDEKEKREIVRKIAIGIKIASVVGIISLVAWCSVVIPKAISQKKQYTEKYEKVKMEMDALMENREYGKAYTVMISSECYVDLKEIYGEDLWKRELERDKEFYGNSLEQVNGKTNIRYGETTPRDGICYYIKEIEKRSRTGKIEYEVSLCALTESGKKKELIGLSHVEGGSIYGIGYKLWHGGMNGTLWSNGWIFVQIPEYGKMCLYAVKYDKDNEKTYKMALAECEASSKERDYAKMKDGNLLIVPGSIDRIENDENIVLFDVVEGKKLEMTYKDLKKRYENKIDENILTRFE